jgi:hypothetical protein
MTLPADAYTNILEGLVSSGLYSLLGQVFRVGNRAFGRGAVEPTIRKSIFSADLSSVVGVGPLAEGSAEELRAFLSSPEAESVVRQIYSFRLTDSKSDGLDSIKEEFQRLLTARVPGADDALDERFSKSFCPPAMQP